MLIEATSKEAILTEKQLVVVERVTDLLKMRYLGTGDSLVDAIFL